jgi:parallel beta-helix repeat protein
VNRSRSAGLPVLAGIFLALVLGGCRESAPTLPDMASASSAVSASAISLEIFVDAVNGNDATGDGSAARPFQTIGRGLEAGSAGLTVIVRPGTYDQALGETFPLRLKDGLTLQGPAAAAVIIDGGGAAVVLEDASQARLEDLTVTGGAVSGLRLRFPSTVASCVIRQNFLGIDCESSVTIEDNIIENNTNSGLRIGGTASPSVRRNTVRFNGGEGIECRDSSAPSLEENEIRENQEHGIVCTNDSSPVLEGNAVTRNVKPEVYLLNAARPTLSGNVIRDNVRYGIDDARDPNQGEISAVGNTWSDPQPSGTVFGPADSRPNYYIKEPGNSIRFSGGAAPAATRRRRHP